MTYPLRTVWPFSEHSSVTMLHSDGVQWPGICILLYITGCDVIYHSSVFYFSSVKAGHLWQDLKKAGHTQADWTGWHFFSTSGCLNCTGGASMWWQDLTDINVAPMPVYTEDKGFPKSDAKGCLLSKTLYHSMRKRVRSLNHCRFYTFL